jgi:molybdopterin-containing oxidoreductase family iron-sulfur binding subunit
MHALSPEGKGHFSFVSPYQTLTGANADSWLACHPGGEAAVLLGLLREARRAGRGAALRNAVKTAIDRVVADYTPDRAAVDSGVDRARYDLLVQRVLSARRPLILGGHTGSPGGNGLQINVAANLLNAVLDPDLTRLDFESRYRVGSAAPRGDVIGFFDALGDGKAQLLLVNNANPVFSLPADLGIEAVLGRDALFVVCFSNFLDDTARLADLVIPVRMPLESWDEYEGRAGFVSTLQPAMGRLTQAPHVGDVLLRSTGRRENGYKDYLLNRFVVKGSVRDEHEWVRILQQGGFSRTSDASDGRGSMPSTATDVFSKLTPPVNSQPILVGAPSIRFFDGRGANRPWLAELPDPLTQVTWQSPVIMHPDTLDANGLAQGDVIRIQSPKGSIEAPIYEGENVRPNVLVMAIGQGHAGYGRYADGQGVNPCRLFPADTDAPGAGPRFAIHPVSIHAAGRRIELAHTDGSRIQHGRKIALKVTPEQLTAASESKQAGLTMHDFPMTLPIPEGYDAGRDFYPPHDHADYRWSMVVDLDRCIGCGACAAACYAENNLGVVGEAQILKGREMAWLRVERYLDPERMEKVIFLPMMCQHCDNAPCESVCPVYAPHHSKEGINNQIYNRCIGTRFCAQNCPYKVRRFNWYTWQWPKPLNLQLNPDVTVRSKGVMEKCSFCIQRIKRAHDVAKNENRAIRDGEVIPACMQTCPTGAFVFGNLMDPNSRVRRMVNDPRAYQVMGYLNVKPAVIYLKKVVHAL